ncbi:Uncharacterized conserved protein [Desulfonatronum zhilinae]|nr:Uncharacterized conserved protein [Desulfonatronum zhilinae]
MMRKWKLMVLVAAVMGLCLTDWAVPRVGLAECAGVTGRSCIRMAGSNAFLGNTVQGVAIYNVEDPANPQEIGCVTTSGCILDMDFHEGYAYIVDDQEGLLILDVRNPERCVSLGNYQKYGGEIRSFTVHGHYALATVTDQGLKIFDISTPTDIKEVASLDQPSQIHGLRIVGEHAYLSNLNGGLHVLDLQDPADPRQIAFVDVPGRPRTMGVADNQVYITTSERKMNIFDISEPVAPRMTAAVEIGNSPVAVLSGDRVVVADIQNGLVVKDISNLTQIEELGRMDLGGIALGVCIRDDHVYLSMAETNDIKVVDLRMIVGEKRAGS